MSHPKCFFSVFVLFLSALSGLNSASLDNEDFDFQPEAMFFDSKRIATVQSSSTDPVPKFENRNQNYDPDYYDEVSDSGSVTESNTPVASNQMTNNTQDSNINKKFAKRWGFARPGPSFGSSPQIHPLSPLVLSASSPSFTWNFRVRPDPYSDKLSVYGDLPHHPMPPSREKSLEHLFQEMRQAESKESPVHVAHHHAHVHSHSTNDSRDGPFLSYGKRRPNTVGSKLIVKKESALHDDSQDRSDENTGFDRDEVQNRHKEDSPPNNEPNDISTSNPPLSEEPSNSELDSEEKIVPNQREPEHGSYENRHPSRGRNSDEYPGRYQLLSYSKTGTRRQEEEIRSPRMRPRMRFRGMGPRYGPPPFGIPPPGVSYGAPMRIEEGIGGGAIPSVDSSAPGNEQAGMPMVAGAIGEEYPLIGMGGRFANADPSVSDTYPLIGGPNPMPPFHFPMEGGMPPMGGSQHSGLRPGGADLHHHHHHRHPHGQHMQASSSQAQDPNSIANLQKMHPGLHPMQYQYLHQWYSYLNQPSIRSYIENFKDPNESSDKKTSESSNSENKNGPFLQRVRNNLKMLPLSLNKIQLPRVREIFRNIRPVTTTTESSSTEYA